MSEAESESIIKDSDVEKLSGAAAEKAAQEIDVSEIVAKYDKESVFRVLGGFWKYAILLLAVAFSLFHLYTAAFGQLPPQLQRSIHLGFTLCLVFLLYPATTNGNRSRMLWFDVVLAAAGVWVCTYIILNYEAIVMQTELPSTVDIIHGGLAILLVLEAARRIVGLPIALVAVAFLIYAKFGNYIPGMMGHRGFSWNRIISHMYLTTEGIFGTPLGVSASFVFLFILFGAFLHKTGLGKFFIDLALSVTGHMAGGPAKVAVVSSCLFGTISGSSVANTVSTGTFTIPLMKSVGYSGTFAGAVEAASSTGGQIMPPIMGAAAFIMSQFLGVPYIEIAIAALLPALLYYLSVGTMVHMEAKRLKLTGIPRERLPKFVAVLASGGYLLIPIIIMIYLLVSGYTPFKSAFYCIVTTVAIAVLTNLVHGAQGRTLANGGQGVGAAVNLSVTDIISALDNGARGALSVAAACASTGLVIGVVTMTGVGLKLANAVLTLSGGNFFLTLLLTMIASIILGMGLPTTAKYIVLATIAAPAIQRFGVPPLAAHLFIMYFGILADLTPPVALCAYAAAGIAKASPNSTGFMAVKLAFAGFLIPYVFAYNPGLLLINTTWLETAHIALTACLGIFALAFACVGYWMGRLTWWQRLILIAGALGLITPGTLSDLAGLATLALVYLTQRYSSRYEGKPAAA